MRGSKYSLDTTAARRRGWFLVPPLFEGPKCLTGVGVNDCTWAPPMCRALLHMHTRTCLGGLPSDLLVVSMQGSLRTTRGMTDRCCQTSPAHWRFGRLVFPFGATKSLQIKWNLWPTCRFLLLCISPSSITYFFFLLDVH